MKNKYEKVLIRAAFGEPILKEVSEIGPAKVHGYTKDGSWFLNRVEGSIPCQFIALKFKGQRKFRWVSKEDILEGLEYL
jgi:hypothetical protein